MYNEIKQFNIIKYIYDTWKEKKFKYFNYLKYSENMIKEI